MHTLTVIPRRKQQSIVQTRYAALQPLSVLYHCDIWDTSAFCLLLPALRPHAVSSLGRLCSVCTFTQEPSPMVNLHRMNLCQPSPKSSICMGCVGTPAGTIVLQKHFLALLCHAVAAGGMNELVSWVTSTLDSIFNPEDSIGTQALHCYSNCS